jgi:hypothetical protein
MEGQSDYGTKYLSFIKAGKVTVRVNDSQLLKKCSYSVRYVTAFMLVCGYYQIPHNGRNNQKMVSNLLLINM